MIINNGHSATPIPRHSIPRSTLRTVGFILLSPAGLLVISGNSQQTAEDAPTDEAEELRQTGTPPFCLLADADGNTSTVTTGPPGGQGLRIWRDRCWEGIPGAEADSEEAGKHGSGSLDPSDQTALSVTISSLCYL